jgi:hypothetical protein
MQRKETEWDLEAAKKDLCVEEDAEGVEQQAAEGDDGLSLGSMDEEL